MPIGTIILSVFLGLMFLGLFHTTLDRLKLTDTQAISILLLIILGSFINIPLTRNLSINMGGIIPVLLGIYVLTKANENMEIRRGILAIILTTGGIYLLSRVLSRTPEPGTDTLYINGLVAGILAYTIGRSRRAAFSAGVLSVFILDIIQLVSRTLQGQPVSGIIAGAGIFDSMIIAGIIGLLFAEVLGETRERAANMEEQRPGAAQGNENEMNNPNTSQKDGGDNNE
jgi:uncharacterized membrane protein